MTAIAHWHEGEGTSSAGFGSVLKRLRVDAGLTQEELALRAHISVKAISALERGVNHAPRKETLQLLERALGVAPSDHAALADAARHSRRLGTGTVRTRAFPVHPGQTEQVRVLSSDDKGEGLGERLKDHANSHGWEILSATDPAAMAREKLGGALMSAARYDEALEMLHVAATVHRAQGNIDSFLRTLARIGETHALRGTPTEGIAALSAAEVLRPGDVSTEALAAAKVVQAWLINCTGRYAEALPVAAEAMEVARHTASTRLQVHAAVRYAHLLLMLGELDRGIGILHNVVELAEASGDLRSLRLALNSLGWVHELRGDLTHDKRHTEKAYQAALDLGDSSVIAFMVSNHGGPAFNAGDWRGARADFELGLHLSSVAGESWASPWSLVLLGQLDIIQGNERFGERRLLQGSEHAARNGDVQAQRWAHGTLAERDLLTHFPLSACQRLAPLVNGEHLHAIDEYVLLPLLAWAALELGEDSRAAQYLDVAMSYARTRHLMPTMISALCVRARLNGRQGRLDQAIDDLHEALMFSDAIQQPYYVAKVHVTEAYIGAEHGNVWSVREHARAALSILTPLGERLYSTVAERLLA